MARLTNPERSELGETRALRDRRDRLLRKADRARYRLHRRPDLTDALRQATTDLLRLEIEARARLEPGEGAEPLGDARPAAVSPVHCRLPYKD